MSMFTHAMYEIARKEFIMLMRSKRLMGVGITILIAMILLTLVIPLTLFNLEQFAEGFAGEGSGVELPHVHNGILLFFLGGFFILSGFFLFQLMPIVLVSDAVCSEWQQRRIFLLLSKPVPRAAFVLGKFLGLAIPLALLSMLLLLIDYGIIVLVYPGVPTGADVGRFFGALGVVGLGVLAFAALSMMFSSLMRSSVAALLLSILSWIVILPLIGQIQFFIDLSNGGIDAITGGTVTWSNYLAPGGMMGAAGDILVPEVGGFLAVFGGGGAAPPWWGACLALLGHTVVYLAISLIVVQVRNFE
jgi:ABC-type transport system involved in multi-copper enzyme maturation permease subunit